MSEMNPAKYPANAEFPCISILIAIYRIHARFMLYLAREMMLPLDERKKYFCDDATTDMNLNVKIQFQCCVNFVFLRKRTYTISKKKKIEIFDHFSCPLLVHYYYRKSAAAVAVARAALRDWL